MVLSDAENEELAAYLLNVEAAFRDATVAVERSVAAREARDIAELDRLDPILSALRARIDTLLSDFPRFP